MAKMIKTFPIIQCSPPLGKWAKGNTPMSIGKRWPRNTVNKIRAVTHWGLAATSRGLFLSHFSLARQGGDNSWVSKCIRMCMSGHTQTHPKTNPWLQTSQLIGLQSRRRRRSGTTLWVVREAISGLLWAEKLPRITWILQLEVNTLGTTSVTGTKPTQAINEEEFLDECFPPLFMLSMDKQELDVMLM